MSRSFPRNGGKDTLMTVRIHTDHAVLREALAGTSKARLAYAPDWMLNLTARPLLRQLAGQIEQGQAVGDPMHGFQSQADWEASLPPDKQREVQEWRQYDASRPMTDPNADAQKFLNGGAEQAPSLDGEGVLARRNPGQLQSLRPAVVGRRGRW